MGEPLLSELERRVNANFSTLAAAVNALVPRLNGSRVTTLTGNKYSLDFIGAVAKATNQESSESVIPNLTAIVDSLKSDLPGALNAGEEWAAKMYEDEILIYFRALYNGIRKNSNGTLSPENEINSNGYQRQKCVEVIFGGMVNLLSEAAASYGEVLPKIIGAEIETAASIISEFARVNRSIEKRAELENVENQVYRVRGIITTGRGIVSYERIDKLYNELHTIEGSLGDYILGESTKNNNISRKIRGLYASLVDVFISTTESIEAEISELVEAEPISNYGQVKAIREAGEKLGERANYGEELREKLNAYTDKSLRLPEFSELHNLIGACNDVLANYKRVQKRIDELEESIDSIKSRIPQSFTEDSGQAIFHEIIEISDKLDQIENMPNRIKHHHPRIGRLNLSYARVAELSDQLETMANECKEITQRDPKTTKVRYEIRVMYPDSMSQPDVAGQLGLVYVKHKFSESSGIGNLFPSGPEVIVSGAENVVGKFAVVSFDLRDSKAAFYEMLGKKFYTIADFVTTDIPLEMAPDFAPREINQYMLYGVLNSSEEITLERVNEELFRGHIGRFGYFRKDKNPAGNIVDRNGISERRYFKSYKQFLNQTDERLLRFVVLDSEELIPGLRSAAQRNGLLPVQAKQYAVQKT